MVCRICKYEKLMYTTISKQPLINLQCLYKVCNWLTSDIYQIDESKTERRSIKRIHVKVALHLAQSYFQIPIKPQFQLLISLGIFAALLVTFNGFCNIYKKSFHFLFLRRCLGKSRLIVLSHGHFVRFSGILPWFYASEPLLEIALWYDLLSLITVYTKYDIYCWSSNSELSILLY